MCHCFILAMFCASAGGDVHINVRDESLPREQAWQTGTACGPNALYCMLRIHSTTVDYMRLLNELSPPEEGSSLEELRSSALRHGLTTRIYQSDRVGFDELRLPFIAHLEQYDFRHYVLVVGRDTDGVFIWDDVAGKKKKMRNDRFFKVWTGYALSTGTRNSDGMFTVILLLECLLLLPMLKLWSQTVRR